MLWWTVWWVWGVAALALITAEVLLPGFIFLGFAVGAGIMALLVFVVTPTMEASVAIFAVASLVAYLVLRKVFGLPTAPKHIYDRDIND